MTHRAQPRALTRLRHQHAARAVHGSDQEGGLLVGDDARPCLEELRGGHDAVRRRAHVVAGGHQVVAHRGLRELVARLR